MPRSIPLVVDVDRDVLAERIEARFEQMLDEGGIEEARQLEARRLAPSLPVMLALGVGPLLRHLGGELSLEEAIVAGKAETRQYAKRQRTWMRSNRLRGKLFQRNKCNNDQPAIRFFHSSCTLTLHHGGLRFRGNRTGPAAV